ncbi:MAG: adenylate/guanylate cyclase domain-containing protein [Chloroflexota bacterium]
MNAAPTPQRTSLDRARDALTRRHWPEAINLLPEAEAEGGVTAADLDALGEAAWWVGRLGLAIELRERAFAAHMAADDRPRAAGTALALANDYSHRLESAIASGWVKRAGRLLTDLPETREHGYLQRPLIAAALGRGDFADALEHAEQLLAIGARLHDPDLEALALQDKGRILVAAGQVEEGMALLDEAVVTAVSGDVLPYTAAVVYCNATVACEDLTDYRRAGEFAEIAKRWCDRQEITGFPGMCRVRRVEIMRLRGAWAEAEAEARRACAELQDFCLDYAGEGFYQIGEIRLRMGDLDGAETAFTQAHGMGRDPQPGLSLLRHAQGRTDAAAATLARALADTSHTPLLRARLLPAEVEVALAIGDIERATAAAEELRLIAEGYGTHVLRASTSTARGQVAVARRDFEAAVGALRDAWRMWQETDAPYESARSRVSLGEAFLGSGNRDEATMELHAAVATFEHLGAAPEAARAAALLRSAAEATSAGPARRAVRTFMFTDIVRSTNLIEAIGDEAWARLLGWHDEMLRALLAEHGGKEIHHAGDGFFVAFPSADAALGCALAIRRQLEEHRRRNGFAPSIRIGLHSAEAVVTPTGFEGRGVHVAARIGALAGADEIVVSTDVLDAAETQPERGEVREERLRGIAKPVTIATLR